MTFTLKRETKKLFTGAVFLVMRLVLYINNNTSISITPIAGTRVESKASKEDFIADRGIELMGGEF